MGVIPQKLVIGFNNRKETYTGKLGYVCYLKGKNNDTVHQQSLASWADKKIPFEYYDNIPTEGFVLNKKAGGTSWGWNSRMIKARVYDPRGFEFEIDMENLLYILENTNTIKGKALEGEFVYGWMGSGSVSLIPVDSEAYKSHIKNETAIGKAKDQTPLKNNELVLGKIYVTRKEELVLYTGEKFGFEKFLNLGNVKDNVKNNEFIVDHRNLKSKTVYKEHEIQGNVLMDSFDLNGINNLDRSNFIFQNIDFKIKKYNDSYYKHEINYVIEIDNLISEDLFINGLGVEFEVTNDFYSESKEYKNIEKYLSDLEVKIKFEELNLIIVNKSYFLLASDDYFIKTQLGFEINNRWARKGKSIINKNTVSTEYFEYLNIHTSKIDYFSNSRYSNKILPTINNLKLVKEIIIK